MIRLWLCLRLPWHRFLTGGGFWPSDGCQVVQCSCGRQYALNHHLRCVLTWDEEIKAFYRGRGMRLR